MLRLEFVTITRGSGSRYCTLLAGKISMKLIVGLGNPGAEYDRTRHNIGFRVIDAFAAKFRIKVTTHEKSAFTGKGRVAGDSVILARPQTFMNRSGEAVRKLTGSYVENLSEMIVIYDDVDLVLGRLRIRENGSPGTHNGMKSIVTSLATESFPRLRFGVRGPGFETARDLADYVLEDFAPDEDPVVEEAIARSVDALVFFCRGDLRGAMNRFNRE